jgi:hypothetical protein
VKKPGFSPPLCKSHNYNLSDLFKVAKQSPFFGIGSLYSGAFAMTESIQDTSPRIHSFGDSGRRDKKPVSDETCPPNLSVGSMLQSKI